MIKPMMPRAAIAKRNSRVLIGAGNLVFSVEPTFSRLLCGLDTLDTISHSCLAFHNIQLLRELDAGPS